VPASDLFNENSDFELGYCMEFLLQTLKSRRGFNADEYTKKLNTLGSSLVVVQSGSIVKVHIHTKEPGPIIEYSQSFGEFATFKLENMQIQHDELGQKEKIAPKKEHKPIGIIAISNGAGVSELFESFNCDVIIDGGKTMNTSSEQILNALNSLNADRIVVYPNHENMFKAVEQAIALSGLDNVTVMPSRSLMECYYSLAMDNGEENLDSRIRSLMQGCEAVTTVSVTRCAKDCVSNHVTCIKGQYVVLLKGSPIACVKTYEDVVTVLSEKNLLSEFENCIIFKGIDLQNFDEQKMQKLIENANSELEISFVDGQQRVYDLVIGLV
jgi:dihydroxyacetone kinase-like predicted kinase